MVFFYCMHKKHTEKYPNFLGAARRRIGLRYKQVARKLNVKSTKIVSQWERGQKMPNGKNMIALCLLYNRTFAQLYPQMVEELQAQLKK